MRNLRKSYLSGVTTIVLSHGSKVLQLSASWFDLGVSGPRIWNDVHFSSFPLLGKLSCRAFGNFLKVPSEVDVQCFFRLGWDHFHASDQEITRTAKADLYANSDSPSSPSSSPSPERIDERRSQRIAACW